jgi:hypothetical protein
LIAGSDKITSNQLSVSGTGSLKFSFTGTPWLIPAGATKTMLVRVDLSNSTASGSEGDFYSFDVAAAGDVTALDSSSNTVNGTAAPNGAGTATKYQTVKNGGTLTMAQSPNSPVKAAAYWGQTAVPWSMFRFTTTNEGQYLEKLTIYASASADATAAKANVKNVTLSYKNKAGDLLTSTQSFTSGASANFGWTYSGSGQDPRPYVPKDSSADVTVKADLRTKAEGATGMSLATPNVNFSLDLAHRYNSSTVNGFRAVGDGSGAVLDGASDNITGVLGKNKQYVYRVYPKFDIVPLSGGIGTLIGTPDVMKFTVTAMGLSDSKLLFDGGTNDASGSIKFEVIASGEYAQAGTSTSFSVFDENNVTVDTGTMQADSNPVSHASLSFNFGSQDVEISGGQSKTFRIQLTNANVNYAKTTATGRAADYFGLVLRDDAAGLINWEANSDVDDNATPSTAGVLRQLEMSGAIFQR